MNLAYVGIFSNASEKRMLICSRLKMSKKCLYYLFHLSLMEHVNKEDVELVDGLVQLFLFQLLVSLIYASPFHLPHECE